MRSLHALTIRAAGVVAAISGVLCGPAGADLRAITDSDDIAGSKLELRSPDGTSCHFTDQERPSLTVGAGVAAAPVIPGYGVNDSYTAGRVGEAQPIAGVILRVPLGAAPSNCRQILAIETATMKLRRAQELYDLGLITLAQFQDVADKAYGVIAKE